MQYEQEIEGKTIKINFKLETIIKNSKIKYNSQDSNSIKIEIKNYCGEYIIFFEIVKDKILYLVFEFIEDIKEKKYKLIESFEVLQ